LKYNPRISTKNGGISNLLYDPLLYLLPLCILPPLSEGLGESSGQDEAIETRKFEMHPQQPTYFLMKKFVLGVIFSGLLQTLNAQTSQFNQALADSLGADEYGMKPYVLVILKTGSHQIANKAKVDSLFRGHMANIGLLANLGKLVVAGPLKKNEKTYRGIFIFNVKTIAEAKTLLETDPAIQAKLLEAELFEWYGSAALPVYLKTHSLIEKKSH
jgi:uncharacterized protein YciI